MDEFRHGASMKALICLSFLVMSLSVLADDLLVVRGGREIRGRFLEENESSIFFYTDYGKKIQIHKSRISVLLRNGDVLALNPPVGNILGIRTDNDPRNQSLSQSNKVQEPVTVNGQPGAQRQLAANSSTEIVPSNAWGLRVGAILGVTQSNASTSTATSSRTGAEAGIVGDYALVSNFHLQSGFLLSQAGYLSGATTVKYSYLKVPVLVKYRRPIQENLFLTAHTGPSLGFRTQSVSEAGGLSTSLNSTTKSTLYGLDLGGGAEYVWNEKMSVFLNLNYSMQLNNLDSTIGGTTVTRLRQLSFLTGFLFSI